MNKTSFSLFLAGIAFLTLLGFWAAQNSISTPPDNEVISDVRIRDDNTDLSELVNNEGAVTVTLVPLNTFDSESGEGLWKFALELNTHSVELSMDVSQAFVLLDDKNNTYPVTSWEGDPPGGHHREIVLAFQSIQPKPKRVTIIARDIGDVSERVFVWNVESDN